MIIVRRIIVALFAMATLAGSGARADIKWEIVRTLPHDRSAFTQGLFVADGLLYESTGLNGRSEIRAMRLSDGQVLRRTSLDAKYFGEGIAPWKDQLVSITWRSGQGFVWQRGTFKQLKTFRYEGEGWGITSDGRRLVMSDGSSSLRFLDPVKLLQTGSLAVTWQGQPVRNLNELEWAKGKIFANVWYSPLIARIDPASGNVEDWINLAPLVSRNSLSSDMVLNGIAWDNRTGLFYVTGKLWPYIYVLRLDDQK